MSQSRDLGQLRQMLDISFDEEELRTIAFDLQVDYDALPGRGKAAKTRELVALLQRSGRVAELVAISAQLRPHFDWIDPSATAKPAPDTRRRRRRLLWGAALAGAVLLLGVAAFFLQRRSSALPPSDGMVLVNAESYPSRPANTAGVGSFWMDRYEVTNAQYAAYDDTYAYPKGEESHPARGLTWDAAKDYCQSQDKRLPTEAEWELAARGPYGWLYPWGDDAEAVELPADNTYPVGGVPVNRSFFGLFDMAGNVAEWVDNPFTPVSNGQRVSRGSAFNQLRNLSVPIPGDPSAAIMIANTGFRCAASKAQVTPPSRLADVKEPHGIGVDDFKAEDAGWPNNPADTEYGYHPSDFYHLTAVAKSIPEKQFFADNDYDNFILEADLFVDLDVADPDGNYRYGLAFRHDDGRYYAFVIAVRDQSWAVLKFLGEGAPVTLASGQSEAIDGVGHTIGETMDRLTVIANGTAMSFLIDGQIVSTLATLTLGAVRWVSTPNLSMAPRGTSISIRSASRFWNPHLTER